MSPQASALVGAVILLLSGCDRFLSFGPPSGADARPREAAISELGRNLEARGGDGRAPAREGAVSCPAGSTLVASEELTPNALLKAIDEFNLGCSPGRSITGISVYSLSACPPAPTLAQVQQAVALEHQSYVSSGGPTTVATLLGLPLFGTSCTSMTAAGLLDRIAAQVSDSNPQIWLGTATVQPSCPGCIDYHVLLLFYFAKVRRVVVVDGTYVYS